MAQAVDERMSRPPTAEEVRAWRVGQREVVAEAIADLLRATDTGTARNGKRGQRAA